uniref:Secreted protein n=1 Tax=Gopherus agassizii TaxID=38772 RepID=A0A452GZP9_9SAUR
MCCLEKTGRKAKVPVLFFALAPGASAARNLVSVGTDQTWMRREQLSSKRQFVFKEPAEHGC